MPSTVSKQQSGWGSKKKNKIQEKGEECMKKNNSKKQVAIFSVKNEEGKVEKYPAKDCTLIVEARDGRCLVNINDKKHNRSFDVWC